MCRAQGTAFTYQGRLSTGTNAAAGSYDLRFALFDALTAGTQQGELLTNSATVVSNGLFTVTLDFGNQFSGTPRWLEIAVRTNGVTAFTNLAPRQPLTPAPYAVYAGSANATNLVGTVSGSQIAAGSIGATQLSNSVSLWNRSGANISYTAGNVGIGTTTPGLLLDVNGDINAGSSLHVGSSTADGTPKLIRFGDANYVSIGENAADDQMDLTAGNFVFHPGGFSAGTPPYQVSVVGPGTANSDGILMLQTTGGTAGPQLRLNKGGPGGDEWVFVANGAVNGPVGALQILDSNSGLSRLFIGTNGNVGMGTTAPQLPLEVNSLNYAVPAAQFGVANCGAACGQTNYQEAIRLWNKNSNGQIGMGLLVSEGSFNSNAVPNVWIGTHYGASADANDFKIATRTGGSTLTDRFYVDGTSGNVGIGTTAPSTRLEVAGEITCVAANITSDRNAKEDFKPVNAREVLAKVVGLPISEWQYKTQSDARHIGPMAQDFREAFALGRDEKHITSVDADGVALAAIQGLNEILEEKNQEVEILKQSVAKLTELVNKLAAKQDGAAR